MNEPFVTIEDVAKHFSVSVSTVRAWVSQKHIGKTHRFRLSDVTEALTKTSSSRSEETVSEDSLAELDEDL